MLPVVELRGSIPVAALMDVPWPEAYVLCVVGNMVPVPFLVLFSRRIFNYLRRGILKKPVQWVERRMGKKAVTVKKYRALGLFILVMIPLPGTGAWTGALVAAALNMRLKHALISIFFGVAAAGGIMTVLSYGLLG
ncbi:MAG TPA: small multi-drug export protein [Candidatus Ventrousia excrementavium]|uniref:Small multi-drug export protein n=1 Tax=Candidatus Ventrousia excrementavium TaxID=2840961 RepID=A0A9D1LKJ6_9CLOT|nr:small multi-drug export protein [Candidatus Ventrousia excrementavium]